MIAVALVVAAPTSALTAAATPVDESQTATVTENVDVWERALLPLRTTSEGATTVSAPQTYINIESASTGDVPLNRERYTIQQANEPVELTFESTTGAGTTELAGDDAQLLAVKLSDGADAAGFGAGSARTDLASIFTNDSAVRSADLLDDADGVESIDDNGVLETTYTPDSSGTYAFVLVTVDVGDGISVQNESVAVDGNVTVVGVEQTIVQAGASTVGPANETATAGENVSFDIETGINDDTATHSVLLVKQGELPQRSTTVRVTGDIGGNVSADQITVESSFAGVDGVANTDEAARLGGVNPSSPQASPSAGIVGLFGFVLSEASPDSTGNNVLHASATTISDDANTTVSVDTLDSWPNGTYKYVHIAVGNNSGALYSDTGTISLNQPGADAGNETGDSDGGGSSSSDDSSSGDSNDDSVDSNDSDRETDTQTAVSGTENADTETEAPTTVDSEDETVTQRTTTIATEAVETTDSGGGAQQPDDDTGGETTQTTVETTSTSGPGFTVLAGVLALLGAGFLARRD